MLKSQVTYFQHSYSLYFNQHYSLFTLSRLRFMDGRSHRFGMLTNYIFEACYSRELVAKSVLPYSVSYLLKCAVLIMPSKGKSVNSTAKTIIFNV